MSGSDGVFNIAKGKVNEYVDRVDGDDPTNAALVVVLLKVVEADGTLEDYDTLAAILAGANTEADFTNYARKVLDQDDVAAPAPDDANNRQEADIPDQTWSSAGGTTDNTLVKLIVCYDPDSTGGTDADLVPLTYHTFDAVTDGNDLVAQIDSAGFFRAS